MIPLFFLFFLLFFVIRYVARFANTTGGNPERQLVCAMASFLDDAVGNVTAVWANFKEDRIKSSGRRDV